ncbi:ATP-binding protein [Streptomyces sp. AM 3-1-1]|uniref:ATP-binding protein n=1 Tax=Streptomyces sp. AM 3-1-1 TaxID=3028711 RepID=UPI0023B88A08|nr:ATP-binding protein [Streptomyces sp. AM 3-1-1]WEH27732.1 ATP-binding protein [Streptomyces sp. AM 3-1-1]
MADMTGHQPQNRQSLAPPVGSPFRPRLGDLALDLAKDGRIGVVVDIPGDTASSYHLREPGGGGDWRAPGTGATLRPAAVPVTHVTLRSAEPVLDRRARQVGLAVGVHHEDGHSTDSLMVLLWKEAKDLCQALTRMAAEAAPPVSAELPRTAESAATARMLIREVLTYWDLAHLTEPAALITSELVGNAVTHAEGGVIRLAVKKLDVEGVRITVSDCSHARPLPRTPCPEALTGRGLTLVDAFASAWGTDPEPEGKRVWAEVRA